MPFCLKDPLRKIHSLITELLKLQSALKIAVVMGVV